MDTVGTDDGDTLDAHQKMATFMFFDYIIIVIVSRDATTNKWHDLAQFSSTWGISQRHTKSYFEENGI